MREKVKLREWLAEMPDLLGIGGRSLARLTLEDRNGSAIINRGHDWALRPGVDGEAPLTRTGALMAKLYASSLRNNPGLVNRKPRVPTAYEWLHALGGLEVLLCEKLETRQPQRIVSMLSGPETTVSIPRNLRDQFYVVDRSALSFLRGKSKHLFPRSLNDFGAPDVGFRLILKPPPALRTLDGHYSSNFVNHANEPWTLYSGDPRDYRAGHSATQQYKDGKLILQGGVGNGSLSSYAECGVPENPSIHVRMRARVDIKNPGDLQAEATRTRGIAIGLRNTSDPAEHTELRLLVANTAELHHAGSCLATKKLAFQPRSIYNLQMKLSDGKLIANIEAEGHPQDRVELHTSYDLTPSSVYLRASNLIGAVLEVFSIEIVIGS